MNKKLKMNRTGQNYTNFVVVDEFDRTWSIAAKNAAEAKKILRSWGSEAVSVSREV
jgi:hypothetical protein